MTSEEREAYYAEQQAKAEQRQAEGLAAEAVENSVAKTIEPTIKPSATATQTEKTTTTPTPIQTPTPTIEPLVPTEAERFAADNDISVALTESLESVLIGMELADSSRLGVFHYELSDVYNFEQVDDWAEGQRYKMWMDMEHVWYAYCKGDAVVGVRDGNGNVFYTAE